MVYVNGIAEDIRAKINFKPFSLDCSSITREEKEQLAFMPELDSGCKVKTNPNKSGSAFAAMYEHAILAGYMRCYDGKIKALVVYTERQNDDESYDYGFVPLSNFKLPRLTKKAKADFLATV